MSPNQSNQKLQEQVELMNFKPFKMPILTPFWHSCLCFLCYAWIDFTVSVRFHGDPLFSKPPPTSLAHFPCGYLRTVQARRVFVRKWIRAGESIKSAEIDLCIMKLIISFVKISCSSVILFELRIKQFCETKLTMTIIS